MSALVTITQLIIGECFLLSLSFLLCDHFSQDEGFRTTNKFPCLSVAFCRLMWLTFTASFVI
jgi:hypothetical protein